jgi:hypothetical protein
MTNPDDNRAAFEAWAIEHNQTIVKNHGNTMYRSSQTHVAWLAWQAAIEHAMKTMCNRS